MIHGAVRRGILAPFLTRGIKNKKVFLPPLRQFKQVNTDTLLPPSLFQQKVVLVVNTASKCGFTPQLKSLQELHSKYASRGLTVLAVPSNDFGSQEPDNEETVEAFYKKEYNVEFPITKKYHVIGPDAHPFFNAIVDQYTEDVAPSWNFEKFFVDNTGDLRAVFPRDVDPLQPEVIETIENLLEELPKEQKQ